MNELLCSREFGGRQNQREQILHLARLPTPKSEAHLETASTLIPLARESWNVHTIGNHTFGIDGLVASKVAIVKISEPFYGNKNIREQFWVRSLEALAMADQAGRARRHAENR